MTAPTLGAEPAYPIPISGNEDGCIYNTLEACGGKNGGLTKRELIAAMAMQSLTTEKPEDCAAIAVAYADALLAELQK